MGTVSSIDRWFKAAIPVPDERNQVVQLGVHMEEFAEMLRAFPARSYLHLQGKSLGALADTVKAHTLPVDIKNVDRVELLDALCDQIVTAIGIAHMMGFDISSALQEVDSSNWSKFENGKPKFDQNGKIIKGVNYFKPKLDKFV